MTILIICAVVFTMSQVTIAIIFAMRHPIVAELERAANEGWKTRMELDTTHIRWFKDENEIEWRRLKSNRCLAEERSLAQQRTQNKEN